ncbi:MAG: hypothetical protein ACAH11_01510 [Sphingomonas sp.]
MNGVPFYPLLIILAVIGWIWTLVSDLRTGELGLSSMKREEFPRLFWVALAGQHLTMLGLIYWMATGFR